MTVRRSKAVQIAGTPDQVKVAVNSALMASRRYRKVHSEGALWGMTYCPSSWPLMNSTRMEVEIGDTTGDVTTVMLRTVSPRGVTGDVFGMYDKYLERLADEITQASGASGTPLT